MKQYQSESKLIFLLLSVVVLVGFTILIIYRENSNNLANFTVLLNRQLEDVKVAPVYIERYSESKNRDYLDKASDHIEKTKQVLLMPSEGGSMFHQYRKIEIKPLENQQIREIAGQLLPEFSEVLDQLDQVWEQELDPNQDFSAVDNSKLSDQLITFSNRFADFRAEAQSILLQKQRLYTSLIVIGLLLIFVNLLFIFLLLKKRVFNPLKWTYGMANNIASGNLTDSLSVHKSSDLHQLGNTLNKISSHIKNATNFAVDIGEGKLDNGSDLITTDDLLGRSLVEMRKKLRSVAEEEKKRNWSVNGIANFSEILRQNQNGKIEVLTNQFLNNLIKYLGANQGGIFLINDTNDDPFIELTACFAYERKKQVHRQLEMEEGLIGQCIKEKDTIYLEEIPHDYVHITSGLGEATPNCLLITPIMVNDEIHGALELAFFNKIESYQREFVETVCITLGSSLSSSKMALKTQKLLDESRIANQELQEKEEEMRQNAEELQSTQEELNRKLNEIEVETNLSNNIVDAINKTNATIEFDMDGTILNVNDMYLSVMGFTKDELIGKNEEELAPRDEMESGRYNMLWDGLKSGSFMSGEYRRLSKGGREVWLNGTYNPIFDVSGKPYKVIQFAQFTTEEKEKDLDLNSKINAISSTFPILDLDREGNIKSANAEFVKLMGYKRLELRNKKFENFVKHEEKSIAALKEIDQIENNFSYVFTLVSKEEKEIPCLSVFTPIRNLSGEAYKKMVVIIDVSDEKKLENELMNNQEKLSQTIRELEVAQVNLEGQKIELESRINLISEAALLFELDAAGNFIEMNNYLKKALDYTGSEKDLNKISFQSVLNPSYNKDTQDEMQKAILDGKVFRTILQYKYNNNIFYGDTTIAPVQEKDAVPYKFVGVIFDVTAQISKENELAHNLAKEKLKNAILQIEDHDLGKQIEEKLFKFIEDLGQGNINPEQILNNKSIPVLHLNHNGEVLFSSKLCSNILGFKSSEMKGKNMNEFMGDNPEKAHSLCNRIKGGNVVEERSLFITKNNDLLELKFISTPVFFNNDNQYSIMLFLLI